MGVCLVGPSPEYAILLAAPLNFSLVYRLWFLSPSIVVFDMLDLFLSPLLSIDVKRYGLLRSLKSYLNEVHIHHNLNLIAEEESLYEQYPSRCVCHHRPLHKGVHFDSSWLALHKHKAVWVIHAKMINCYRRKSQLAQLFLWTILYHVFFTHIGPKVS